jgi:hypothetical protein
LAWFSEFSEYWTDHVDRTFGGGIHKVICSKELLRMVVGRSCRSKAAQMQARYTTGHRTNLGAAQDWSRFIAARRRAGEADASSRYSRVSAARSVGSTLGDHLGKARESEGQETGIILVPDTNGTS